MAASRDPDAYPASFHMILERFRDGGEPFTAHFARAEDAERTRFRFYDFKKALKLSGRTDDLRIVQGVSVQLTRVSGAGGGDGSASLTFSARDNADWSLALEAAMEGVGEGAGTFNVQGTVTGRYSSSNEGNLTDIARSNTPKTSHDDVIAGYLKKGDGK